jgi:hypothetical protein
MKFSAQRLLMSKLVGKVSPFLVKGSGPYDPGQYLKLEVVKAGDGVRAGITAKIMRQDVMAIATIDAGASEGMLKVSRGGSCVMAGGFLAGHMEVGNQDESLDFEMITQAPKKAKEKDEEDPMPDSLGKLSMSFPGAKGRRDHVNFASMDIPFDASIASETEEDTKSSAAFQAKNLAKYGTMINIAVGNAQMNLDYSLVLLRIGGKAAELVTLNGAQLAIAKVPENTGSKHDEYILPYKPFSVMANQLDEDADVRLYKSKDTARGRVVFNQPIRLGGKHAGQFWVSIPLSEKFVKFADKIESLDLKYSFKVRKPDLLVFCRKFDLFNVVRTTLTYDPKQGTLVGKKCDQNGDADLSLAVEAIKGDILELDVSSRHITEAANAVSGEQEIQDLQFHFSGKKSLAMIEMGKDIRQYFAPFRE